MTKLEPGTENEMRTVFAANVAMRRKATGLSQAGLADRFGALLGHRVQQQLIAKIETNNRGVSLFEGRLLAQALECSVEDLLPVQLPSSKSELSKELHAERQSLDEYRLERRSAAQRREELQQALVETDASIRNIEFAIALRVSRIDRLETELQRISTSLRDSVPTSLKPKGVRKAARRPREN